MKKTPTILVVLGLAALISASPTRLAAIDISPSKPEGGRGGATINPESDPKEASKPSLFKNPFKWLFGKSDPRKRLDAPPEFDADLSVGRKVYSSEEDDAIEVKLSITNKSAEKYILRFPTAQHFDFIVTDDKNNELYRWSGDKEFAQKLSTIVVNSKEKLTYPGEEPLLIPIALNDRTLQPGQYRLIGIVTSEKPIRISTSFEVENEDPSASRMAERTHSASPAVPAHPVDESQLPQ